ncbi:MAG TPA: hypothetical protein VEY94_04530, partial [Patescibacteria group bacterium]|nr:hypothetical protein [Patescibacteria group bacterium]
MVTLFLAASPNTVSTPANGLKLALMAMVLILWGGRWFACGSVATLAKDRRARVNRSDERRRETESTRGETG